MVHPRRHLAVLSLTLAAACGGGDGGGNPQPTPTVSALFRVHVPDNTPAADHVYIAADFNGWNPASPEHRLTEVSPYLHELTLSFPVGTHVEFKLTRGSWVTVEKNSNGQEIPNRAFDLFEDGVLDLTVQLWADQSPSTRTGDVTTTSVPGFLQGRVVWVYLPPGYAASTARYPVLYMLDGQNVFDRLTSFAGEWKVDETLERLIPAGEVQPLIVVAVENGSSARIEEYTPWPDPGYPSGSGGAHLDAIADVLVPWVDTTYRTLTGPAHTGFGGSSLGGLMTVYAVYERPDVFGFGMAMSPSIWWDSRHLVTYVSGAAKPSAKLWTDMGTAEGPDDIADLRALRDALVGQGFVLGTDLTAVEDPNAMHNEAAWSRRFPDAVKFLFPPAP